MCLSPSSLRCPNLAVVNNFCVFSILNVFRVRDPNFSVPYPLCLTISYAHADAVSGRHGGAALCSDREVFVASRR